MITQTLKLNLIPGQVLPRVNVSQYDAGTRTLQMLLYNGDQAFNIPVGYGGFVQGTKPDRTGFQYAATVTEGSNVVTLVITQQMAAVSGEVTCELVIANGDDRIATVNFILYVEPAALAGDTVISDTELPLIEEAAELAQRIDGITQQVNEDAQTASNAATAATAAQTAAEAAADEAEEWGTHPPYIGANGNWYVYNPTTETYQDSGVKAQGPLSGLTDVEITNAQDGQEITYDGTTQKWKNTSKIQTLTNQVKDMNNVYGAKNLLPIKLYDSTYGGFTYTRVDDYIIVNGTSTGSPTQVSLFDKVGKGLGNATSISLKDLGIDTSKEYVIARATKKTNLRYKIEFLEGKTSLGAKELENSHDLYRDIPFSDYPTCDRIRVLMVMSQGLVLTNEEIKPMICLKSVYELDSTYEPYAKTNQQLTQDTTALLDNTEVNGAVNMLNFAQASEVKKGYTFTNIDGVVTVTGSRASGETGNADHNKTITLPKGTYKISGCPSGGSDNTWRLLVDINNGAKYAFDYGEGAVFTLTEESTLRVYCTIMANYSDTVNLTFKPMITVPSYNGDYVPYAKSNKELTEELKNRLPLLIDSGTINPNSSKTISIKESSSAMYRLTLGSIGADSCGRIVIFGKHPSVANIRYATFDCVDINASYAATISVSGSSLTITSATNSNCMYTLEKIRA